MRNDQYTMGMPLPNIKIELEAMKHSIVYAFTNEMLRQVEGLSDILDKVIADFDFEKEIRSMAQPLLREALEKSVRNALHAAVNDLQYGQNHRTMVAEMKDILQRALTPPTDTNS